MGSASAGSPAKRRHAKAHRSIAKPLLPAEPKNERDKKFCERWLVHFDHNRAYTEAGYQRTQNSSSRAMAKLHSMRPYLEKLRPHADKVVGQAIGRERVDVIKAIEHIGIANVLDYVREESVYNVVTQMFESRLVLKPLGTLTREQASALDTVSYDLKTGFVSYTLPDARTRLKALTVLGEQTNVLKKKDDGKVVHNHVHLEGIPLEKLKQVKLLLMDAVGPQVVREVLGIQPEDQGQ